MLRRLVRRARPVLVVLGAASLAGAAACSPAAGDRAGGGCPEGETCSPDTPDGLYFGGAILSDDASLDSAPKRIARGGVETIRAFLDAQAERPFSPFEALAGGDHITVLDRKDNAVRVRGESPVGDFLRLVDPDTQELYDRKMLEVGDVATLKLVPREANLQGDAELYDAALPDVVWKSSNADNTFTIALVDATGVRLVDESLDVQSGAGFTHTSDYWDGLHQTDAVAPGTYSFNVKLGNGDTHQVSVTLVDKADAVAWVAGHGADAQESPERGLASGRTATYCFRATNAGRPVLGDAVSFVAAGQIQVDQTRDGCATVHALGAGTGTLTVRVDDVSLEVSLPVTAAAAKRSGGDDDDGPLQGTPLPAVTGAAVAGDRAAALARP